MAGLLRDKASVLVDLCLLAVEGAYDVRPAPRRGLAAVAVNAAHVPAPSRADPLHEPARLPPHAATDDHRHLALAGEVHPELDGHPPGEVEVGGVAEGDIAALAQVEHFPRHPGLAVWRAGNLRAIEQRGLGLLAEGGCEDRLLDLRQCRCNCGRCRRAFDPASADGANGVGVLDVVAGSGIGEAQFRRRVRREPLEVVRTGPGAVDVEPQHGAVRLLPVELDAPRL